MSEDKFLEELKHRVSEKLGNGVHIKSQRVRKNNNVVYLGLILHREGCNIAPTLYVNSLYEEYQKGADLEELAEHVVQSYHQGAVKTDISMDFFMDFEKVKERIAYRLINAEMNKELLKDIPHILFLDWAICFYYAFHHDTIGEGMILIHNSHMDMWKTNHEELMKLAVENTKRMFPPMLMSLGELLKDMWLEPTASNLYVLSNEQKCHGSIALLYPGMLREAAELLGGDFFVLPSSIHEVLLLRRQKEDDTDVLLDMISEANRNHVMEEELLSYHLYYYDTEQDKLLKVEKNNENYG